MRSCEIFTASLINPYLLQAYQYESWGEYLASQKSSTPYYMGILADHSIPQGKYYMAITIEEIRPYLQTETTILDSIDKS